MRVCVCVRRKTRKKIKHATHPSPLCYTAHTPPSDIFHLPSSPSHRFYPELPELLIQCSCVVPSISYLLYLSRKHTPEKRKHTHTLFKRIKHVTPHSPLKFFTSPFFIREYTRPSCSCIKTRSKTNMSINCESRLQHHHHGPEYFIPYYLLSPFIRDDTQRMYLFPNGVIQ